MMYDIDRYNCSHFVAEYYAARGITVPSGTRSEWGLRFIRWMRRCFTRVDRPAQDCLVLIKYRGHGSFHVGVYDDGMVTHNHRIGQVIRTPLTLLRAGADISYWAHNGNN